MNSCATTRLLVPATLVAVLVASLTNSDAIAFASGLVTAGAVWAYQRLRGRATAASCSLAPATRPDGADQLDQANVTPVSSSESAHNRRASSSL